MKMRCGVHKAFSSCVTVHFYSPMTPRDYDCRYAKKPLGFFSEIYCNQRNGHSISNGLAMAVTLRRR